MEQLDATLFAGPSIHAARAAIVVTVRAPKLGKLPAREAAKRARAILPQGAAQEAVLGAVAGPAAVRWPELMARLALALQKSRFEAPLSHTVEDVREAEAKRIIVETHEPEVVPFAATAAFDLTRLVFTAKKSDPAALKRIQFCLAMIDKNRLGWNTVTQLEACQRRGIPFSKTLANSPFMTLGQGIRRQRIRSSTADSASFIATQLADDKHLTKRLWQNYGIPVAEHRLCNALEETEASVAEIGFPLVVKGRHAEQGLSVSTGIRNMDQAKAAVRKAAALGRSWLIERHVEGEDYRFTVVDGRVVAVARRLPAHVVGDGKATVAKLIEGENRRREGLGRYADWLVPLQLDDEMRHVLAHQELTAESIPEKGCFVRLRHGSNISQGGVSEDATEIAHPDTMRLMERAAGIIGHPILGLDVLSPDIARPLGETGGVLIEANTAPGLRPHYVTPSGPRDVADAVIASLFPEDGEGRIPTVAVTGTNGKTTTCRMLCRIFEAAGMIVGTSGTHGTWIAGTRLRTSDDSGGYPARLVLQDPTVEAGVFELGRGGLLKQGTVCDRFDVGIVTNVTEDHLHQDGLETLDDIARVKRLVVERARVAAVLNADNTFCAAMAPEAAAPIWWFSQEQENPTVARHLAQGGNAILVEGAGEKAVIVQRTGQARTELMLVADIPLTLGGRARHNVANAQAAMAAALALGVPIESFRTALQAFTPSADASPGRLNIRDVGGIRLVVDFAHNEDGVGALCETFRDEPVSGQRVCVITASDNRDDGFYAGLVCPAARHFDRFFLAIDKKRDATRSAEEVAGVIARALAEAGADANAITVATNQETALADALASISAGDLFIAMGLKPQIAWDAVAAYGTEEAGA